MFSTIAPPSERPSCPLFPVSGTKTGFDRHSFHQSLLEDCDKTITDLCLSVKGTVIKCQPWPDGSGGIILLDFREKTVSLSLLYSGP